MESNPTGHRPSARTRVLLWGPVVAYCGLIFGLSSVSNVPALPGHMSDKLAHAILYTGLGSLVARALAGGLGRRVTPSAAALTVAFAAAYGLSDECHQLFVPLRSFELLDLASDAAGGAIGAALAWLCGILRRS